MSSLGTASSGMPRRKLRPKSVTGSNGVSGCRPRPFCYLAFGVNQLDCDHALVGGQQGAVAVVEPRQIHHQGLPVGQPLDDRQPSRIRQAVKQRR